MSSEKLLSEAREEPEESEDQEEEKLTLNPTEVGVLIQAARERRQEDMARVDKIIRKPLYDHLWAGFSKGQDHIYIMQEDQQRFGMSLDDPLRNREVIQSILDEWISESTDGSTFYLNIIISSERDFVVYFCDPPMREKSAGEGTCTIF